MVVPPGGEAESRRVLEALAAGGERQEAEAWRADFARCLASVARDVGVDCLLALAVEYIASFADRPRLNCWRPRCNIKARFAANEARNAPTGDIH